MGDVRYREMLDVAQTLDLSSLTVLDLPDSGLKEMDPRAIESVLVEHVHRLRPDVLATYAVHGISGFHDHLVTHAVVKRVFVERREHRPAPRRLAFVTLTEDAAAASTHFPLSGSTAAEIDCVIDVSPGDAAANLAALDAYTTFQETIDASGVREQVGGQAVFELFQEDVDPPLTDLFAGLEEAPG